MKLYTWHEHVFSPFVCLVLFCLRQHIHGLRTTSRGSRVLRMSSHPRMKCAVLPRPWSPFPSSSSSSHSSLTPCTSSCTSLRTVATLRTSPERRWTLLTTPTSSQTREKTTLDETITSWVVCNALFLTWDTDGCRGDGLWTTSLVAYALSLCTVTFLANRRGTLSHNQRVGSHMFRRQRVHRHTEKLDWNNISVQPIIVAKVTVGRHVDCGWHSYLALRSCHK